MLLNSHSGDRGTPLLRALQQQRTAVTTSTDPGCTSLSGHTTRSYSVLPLREGTGAQKCSMGSALARNIGEKSSLQGRNTECSWGWGPLWGLISPLTLTARAGLPHSLSGSSPRIKHCPPTQGLHSQLQSNQIHAERVPQHKVSPATRAYRIPLGPGAALLQEK